MFICILYSVVLISVNSEFLILKMPKVRNLRKHRALSENQLLKLSWLIKKYKIEKLDMVRKVKSGVDKGRLLWEVICEKLNMNPTMTNYKKLYNRTYIHKDVDERDRQLHNVVEQVICYAGNRSMPELSK